MMIELAIVAAIYSIIGLIFLSWVEDELKVAGRGLDPVASVLFVLTWPMPVARCLWAIIRRLKR